MEEKAKNIIELKNICKVYDDNGFIARIIIKFYCY